MPEDMTSPFGKAVPMNVAYVPDSVLQYWSSKNAGHSTSVEIQLPGGDRRSSFTPLDISKE